MQLRQFWRHKSSDSSGTVVPAYQRKPLLDETQRELYECLMQAVGEHSKVFAKVRLADLVKNPGSDPKFRTHWTRVQRRAVDFLLLSPNSLTPVMAIKLESKANNKRRRMKGPDVVEDVLRDINVPLLRLPVQEHYEVKDLVKKMRFTLSDYKQKSNVDDLFSTDEVAIGPNQVVMEFARNTLPTLSRWTSGLWMVARNVTRPH